MKETAPSCCEASGNPADLNRLKVLTAPFSATESARFGLAIQVSNPATNQLHALTIYWANDNLMLGDLAWHLNLRGRKYPIMNEPKTYWVIPSLLDEDQVLLSATLQTWIAFNRDKIPYSVAHPGGVIFRDNIWIGKDPAQGLTCSTFIVALFNELGLPFINSETWQDRTGDEEWASNILQLLTPRISKENVDAQRDMIGKSPRIRPSDILAAGLILTPEIAEPLHFNIVNPASKKVEQLLLGDFCSKP